jgi:hypothetical protein
VTERGGRYGEMSLAYRRRHGPVWWQAVGFGRVRQEGDPSGGLGGRATWKVGGPFRLQGGVLGVTQAAPSGQLATLWVDGELSARVPLGHDFFLAPSGGGWLREGREGDPGDGALDPDVWSRFDVDHPRALFGQLRLSYEPFLDLHFHARGRATSNADPGSLDRAAGRVGASGAVGRLRLDGSLELERRFADDDRLAAKSRLVVRNTASWGVWHAGPNRLSLLASTAIRPYERSDLFVGLAYDWTFGRGLRDYAPAESAFSGQLGPYGDEEAFQP